MKEFLWTASLRHGAALLIVLLAVLCPVLADEWQLVEEDDFDQPGWEKEWTLTGPIGPTDQGALLTAGKECRAKWNRTLNAPAVRIEYDATLSPAESSDAISDLSVWIGAIFFQFGGENNAQTLIQAGEGAVSLPSDHVPVIEPGRQHHVVAELNGLHCRLIVDGQTAAQALLPKPMTAEAVVTLYTSAGKARFDNVRAWIRAKADPPPADLVQRVEEHKRRERSKLQPPHQPEARFGDLRAAPTIHSVGIEWDLEGDNNHNAVCAVRYRRSGAADWKAALPLPRIDYRGWYDDKKYQAYRHFNMFAGSIMFLEPNTRYEIELNASDPDGGAEKKTLTLATRAVPQFGAPARTRHVAPGEGGGTGTKEDPFKGLAAADKEAQPGDLFLLHAGEYQGCILQKSGLPGKPIAWKSAGDGEVVLRSELGIGGHQLWIEGLTFAPREQKDTGGIRGKGHPHHDIIAVLNVFRNCRYGVSNTDKVWDGDPKLLNRRWYIADNICEGGAATEYFVRAYMLADSDICYNRIATSHNGKEGDGIATRFSANLDIYGNDIHDADDDVFEPDSAYANIRIWRNRGVNPSCQAVSFQPMLCGPWYIVQNEFVLTYGRHATPFKCNVFDRNVIVNNTFFVCGRYGQCRADIMFKGLSRNNLWVHHYDNPDQKTNPRGAIWSGEGDNLKDGRYTLGGQTKPDWRTDVDYDGFAWSDGPDMAAPFWWMGLLSPERDQLPYGCNFPKLEDFVRIMGVEAHAVALDLEEIFETPDVPKYAQERWSSQRLTLKKNSQAIDAGAPVPNLREEFQGKAPDLGAYEFGEPKCHYGPRR